VQGLHGHFEADEGRFRRDDLVERRYGPKQHRLGHHEVSQRIGNVGEENLTSRVRGRREPRKPGHLGEGVARGADQVDSAGQGSPQDSKVVARLAGLEPAVRKQAAAISLRSWKPMSSAPASGTQSVRVLPVTMVAAESPGSTPGLTTPGWGGSPSQCQAGS